MEDKLSELEKLHDNVLESIDNLIKYAEDVKGEVNEFYKHLISIEVSK